MKGNRKLGEPDTEAVKEFLMKSNPLNIESHAYNPGTPCRAVRQGHEGGIEQPRAISMIANPSARVQMAAVRRDKSVICFIERPTEKVQLAAVRNAPHNIHFITSPSERVQLAVIGNRPSYIGFIPNPTEKVQLKAVEKRPECIFLLQKPAEKVQLTAVLKDPRYLSAIREPTEKVQLAAVQKNPECIRHIAEPTEKVQHMAVQRSRISSGRSGSLRKACGWRRCRPRGRTSGTCPPRRNCTTGGCQKRSDEYPVYRKPYGKGAVRRSERRPGCGTVYQFAYGRDQKTGDGNVRSQTGKCGRQADGSGRTSETSGASGKKALEGVAKKPSAKQVREAVEKLDSEIREINREYFQATYEAQYSDNPAERESEVSAAGKNREKKLVKAYEKFNSAAVPERKECNVGKIVKELRKERVAVENMKAGEWHSLMKGRPYIRPLFPAHPRPQEKEAH